MSAAIESGRFDFLRSSGRSYPWDLKNVYPSIKFFESKWNTTDIESYTLRSIYLVTYLLIYTEVERKTRKGFTL